MPKKVLIIEDNADVAQGLADFLNVSGFEARIALDALCGVTAAHRFKPDLILLDLMLPAGGGLMVLKTIKLSTHTNKIPVLVITGSLDEDYKKKVSEYGVSTFLQKPCNAGQVLSEAKKLLQIA